MVEAHWCLTLVLREPPVSIFPKLAQATWVTGELIMSQPFLNPKNTAWCCSALAWWAIRSSANRSKWLKQLFNKASNHFFRRRLRNQYRPQGRFFLAWHLTLKPQAEATPSQRLAVRSSIGMAHTGFRLLQNANPIANLASSKKFHSTDNCGMLWAADLGGFFFRNFNKFIKPWSWNS